MKRMLAAARLILTLDCEHSSRLVSDSLDRSLSRVERCAVYLHYIGCWSCRRFGKQVRLLRETLRMQRVRDGRDEMKLSPEAVQRIRDAIHQAGTDRAT